jgi:hypothetical protein
MFKWHVEMTAKDQELICGKDFLAHPSPAKPRFTYDLLVDSAKPSQVTARCLPR